MDYSIGRRAFLQTTAAAAFAAPPAPVLKLALNAYSFSKLLNDSVKGRGGGVNLIEVLEFAHKHGCEGFDPTGYFFPGYPGLPENAFVDKLKKRAAELGVGISGTGVRNNFTTSDKAVRTDGVKHIKAWVEVAARLGAPVIRVFADTQMRNQTWQTVSGGATREQVQDWIASAIRQCALQGQKYGVRIGVQNHGDFLKTGKELMALVNAVGSKWCGPIVDTGYFKGSDPYDEIASVAGHAVNWQIKESPFGQDSEIPTDLVRLMKIIRKSGYSGYLPVETLSPREKAYDPFTVVPRFLKQVQLALRQTA
ncbi:MAG: sugar phosphate isomerase/epimerase [Candidatus Solibacter usitatus]|nr:sugar phosphate isomerase/epimerase [Candidatus Solibacter usitatus]